jgi:hypothetical protein
VETLLSIRPLLCDGVLGMTAADHVQHISKTFWHYMGSQMKTLYTY